MRLASSAHGLSTRTSRSDFQTIASRVLVFALLCACVLGAVPAHAQSFDPVDPGLDYSRTPSATIAVAEAIAAQGELTMEDLVGIMPIKPHGAPGVAALDFDGDGDLDLYVTNGPGTPNSLFSNQLVETGEATFVDLAVGAGVAATDQDSTGVCFGDIDNDGDRDLYVLGRSEPNRLFENLGGGNFADVTAAAGLGGGDHSSVGCSFADVDGDGLLDVVIANAFDLANSLPIFIEPFALNEPNQLFVNTGGNVFVDRSEASGVAAAQDITWAIAMVDIDQDGDADVVNANDNGGIPFASMGGVDRGFVRVLKNDGTGNFTDVTAAVGLARPGDWMGLAFADFDRNGELDIFGTNSGDYFEAFFGLPVAVGDQSSRWFLQNSDGSFADPGVGALNATPFGWGAGAYDHDLDGDSDIVFIGGLDGGMLIELSNPGSVLLNDGDANFSLSTEAFDDDRHSHRVEHGLALADLNRDGFQDLVTVSAINVPDGLLPFGFDYDSVYDPLAKFFPSLLPTNTPGTFVVNPDVANFEQGTVLVELSSGNGNNGIQVNTLGTADILDDGVANRDGIGAVVRVTPRGGETAIHPVLGGSSYASQHSLTQTFGLGEARFATVEVLWPGGTVNRLYGVKAGETVVMPEIPCAATGAAGGFVSYVMCVRSNVYELHDQGILNNRAASRVLASAILDWFD